MLPPQLNDPTAMKTSDYAIGQAVYIRTDSPDFEEVSIPFRSLGELVEVCSKPRDNLTLDKIVVYAMPDGEPHAITLGFLSASKSAQPGNLEDLLKNG